MRRLLFAVLLIGACETGAAAEYYEDAQSAIQRGDDALAARLLRSLAEQGDSRAQVRLGAMYIIGQGVPEDYQKAAKWFRRAAEKGDARAQAMLGELYTTGQGVPQNYQEATNWLRRAAEQGDAEAQSNLGLSYELGHGVAQDFIHAHMWLNFATAALSGEKGKTAMENRDRVALHMTVAEIAKAQQMARRCQEMNFKGCE